MELTWELKIEKSTVGTSLLVQWLRLHTPIAGHGFWSLVRKVRSHMPHNVAKKERERERNLQLYLSTTVSLCGCSIVHLCLTLYDPMDCSPPGSSVCGILQARILGWVAFPTPGNLPNPGTETSSLESPALAGGFFTNCTIWEAPSTTALCNNQ